MSANPERIVSREERRRIAGTIPPLTAEQRERWKQDIRETDGDDPYERRDARRSENG